MVSPRNLVKLTMQFVADNSREFIATVSFVGTAVGFWMAWPPLGLIIPCGFVFGSLAYTKLRSESKPHA